MAVQSARSTFNLTVVETLGTNVPAIPSAGRNVTHSAFNFDETLSASSTPDAELVAAFTLALSAGAATIDLTDLDGTNGAAVDFTGKKIRQILINRSAGTAVMAFTEGASNGYGMLGDDFTFEVPIGGAAAFYLKDGAPAVSGSVKTIDVTGTGTDTAQIIIVAG